MSFKGHEKDSSYNVAFLKLGVMLKFQVKPLPQNDSSLQPATITRDISNYLKEGKVTEAASHSIAVLSVGVDDKVRTG